MGVPQSEVVLVGQWQSLAWSARTLCKSGCSAHSVYIKLMPFSSSASSMAFRVCPVTLLPTLQISLHPVSAFYRRRFFPAARFNEPSRGSLKLLSSKEFFGPTILTFSQCSCSNSLANPIAETGELLSQSNSQTPVLRNA